MQSGGTFSRWASLLGLAGLGPAALAEAPAPASPAPAPAPAPVADAAPKKKRRRIRGVRNPGFFQDTQQEFQKVSAFDVFNGGRFEIFFAPIMKGDKAFGIHLKAASDSATIPGGYTLHSGVEVKHGPDKLVSAVLDQNWGINGKLSYNLDKKTTLKSSFLANGKDDRFIADILRKNVDNCLTGKLALGDTTTVSVSNMQAITPFVSLGAELTHQMQAETVLSLVGKYKWMFKSDQGEKAAKGHTAVGQVNSKGIAQVSYVYQHDSKLSFATEVCYSALPGGLPGFRAASGKHGSSSSVAVRYDYQSFVFQGKFSPSHGTVAAFLESKLNSAVSTLFSGEMNHFTGDSRFGLGLRVRLG